MKRIILSLIALLLSVQISYSQAPTKLCITTNGNNCIEIQGNFPFPVYQSGSTYTNITTSTNTVIKAAAGTFAGLVVNSAGPTGSSATVYDNTACSGTVIGTFTTTAQGSIPINAAALTGICVTTISAANLTVLWR